MTLLCKFALENLHIKNDAKILKRYGIHQKASTENKSLFHAKLVLEFANSVIFSPKKNSVIKFFPHS